MKTKTLFQALLHALVISGCATADIRITAVRADKPPVLDGNSAEGFWRGAEELRLEAKARGGPTKGEKTTVILKAAYDDEQLFFLLRWHDGSKNDTHKSYVWNDEKGAYEVGPDREDNAALSFPIRGPFTANMLSGRDELWDVWHWKAHRTGPAGYAMDRTHRFSSTKPPEKARQFTARNGKEVWIARPEDDGSSITKGHPTPDNKQVNAPVHYEAFTPSGSTADIRTGQSYRDGWWTVEFARKLRTGYPDDAQFSVPGSYQLGVAVFDKSEHEHHYTVGPITLELGDELQARVRGPKTTFSFDKAAIGRAPNGWSIRETRPTTKTATWQVVADSSALSKPNVLALTRTENYDSTFNLAVADNTSFKDLDLSVKVKAITGEEDQGGGPIWRSKDENNYYISRFNPLEGNYRVYKVVNGKRKQLDTARIETEPGKWYAIRVTMVGDHITCYLDGKKLLGVWDNTFEDFGMVGFWTKADAVTRFDDLVVHPLVKR